MAQGAQRTFYPTPPPSIIGRNRKIGGRRRARRGGLGGRCRAYTGGDAAGGATRRAAGSEHLIFPCGRVDGGVEERGWGEAGTTAQHTVRARGKGPPLWPRAAQQGPGMNMLATRTQRGARCTVHRAAKWEGNSCEGHLIGEEWEWWAGTEGVGWERGGQIPCVFCWRGRAWCHAPRSGPGSERATHGARCTVHRAPWERLEPWAHGAPCTAEHHSGAE